MTGGFGGGAQVLVGVLGTCEEEATEGRVLVRVSGAAAQLGFQWWELVGRGGDEPLDQDAIRKVGQRVPVKSLGESGRKVASCSTDFSQETMSGSCSASQPK